jgi:glycosyltransferase involved in cell wall biosynthesis
MKVNVVTPSYNQGSFIRRTIESVAGQSGAEIEHVVLDGGSNDETVSVLESFGDQIRWVSEKDGGQADAVNRGIAATDGEIIGWLNSDDVYYPGAIASVVDVFQRHPDVDVVYGMADHIDREDVAFEAYPSEPWNFDRLLQTCFICQPALFFRRSVVQKHGALDANLNYCMDYEYWLRLGKAGTRFAYIETKLAGSRLYAENKTLGSRVKVHAEINDMMKALFGRVPDRWLWNYAHACVDPQVDRSRTPRWYSLRLLVAVSRAALKWNGRISAEMRIHIVDLWRRAQNRSRVD